MWAACRLRVRGFDDFLVCTSSIVGAWLGLDARRLSWHTPRHRLCHADRAVTHGTKALYVKNKNIGPSLAVSNGP